MKLALAAAPSRFLVRDGEACEQVLRRLSDVSIAGIDTETTTGPQWQARSVTVQVAWEHGEAIFFEPYLTALNAWTKRNPTGIFYSAKGDLWSLENAGIQWPGAVHDAIVVDYLFDENIKVRDYETGLKERYAQVFGGQPRPGYRELFSVRGRGVLGADEVLQGPLADTLIDYGLQDARDTWTFYWHQRALLEKVPWTSTESMFDYFEYYDVPFTKLLYRMERRGVLLDEEQLRLKQQEARLKIMELERQFYKGVREAAPGWAFTDKIMGSPQQLRELFYDILKYPPQYNMDRATRQLTLTTDEEALETLTALKYPLPAIILKSRVLRKLEGTYLNGLLTRLSPAHRIHTQFIQAFAVTGRLSSRDPNLQNIPRPENDEFNIRRIFVAPPGMHMVALDYSQIETRLMAHMSGDDALIRACETSDVYSGVAAEITERPLSFFDEVDGKRSAEAKELRQAYKAIVLGVGFGKQAKSIARDLGIAESKAEEFLRSYFKKYKKLYAYMQQQIRTCRDTGYVRTITGRYRHLKDIRSENSYWRGHAERQTLNSPIQGSALDMLKKAMLNIDACGVCAEYGAHMVLTVHDELVFECPDDASEPFMAEIQGLMVNPFDQPLSVKIAVDGGYGPSWGHAKG